LHKRGEVDKKSPKTGLDKIDILIYTPANSGKGVGITNLEYVDRIEPIVSYRGCWIMG